MWYSSIKHMRYEDAKDIYKWSRKYVNTMVRCGKISPQHAEKAFAKRVCEELAKSKLPIPKKMAEIAGISVAKTATKAAGSAVAVGGAVAAKSTGICSVITSFTVANPIGAAVIGVVAVGTIGYGLYKLFKK